jgi:hypothetical protein
MAENETTPVIMTLAKLEHEHKFIISYLEKFETMVNESELALVHEKLQAIAPHLHRQIIDHFAFEEEFIFPAALSGTPSSELIRMVLRLQKEHGIIEREIMEVFDLVTGSGDFTAHIGQEIALRAHRVTPIIREHTARESHDLAAVFRQDSLAIDILTSLLETRGRS